MTNIETYPGSTHEQLLRPADPEVLHYSAETAQEIGSVALSTEITSSTSELLIGKYDHLTTPLPTEKDKLKQALGLGNGLGSDGNLEVAATHAELERSSARVVINTPTGTLRDFLVSGVYKSALETGISVASNREAAEIRRGMRVENEQHLVYGYMTTSEASVPELPDLVSSYGGVRLILKPEVLARSTFTSGDSMDMGVTSESLRGPEDAFLLEQSRRLKKQTGGDGINAKYIEAQIHEGVSVDDIEKIEVPLDDQSSLESLIEVLETNLPESTKKVIKIDVTDGFYEASKSLQLIQEHPEVTFELVVTQTLGATDSYPVPFIGRHYPDTYIPKIEKSYQNMENRFQELSVKLSDFANTKGLELPTNLKLTKGFGDSSFMARKQPRNPGVRHAA